MGGSTNHYTYDTTTTAQQEQALSRLSLRNKNSEIRHNWSGILVQPALIDANFRKAWMPCFRRERHPVVSPEAVLLEFVGDHLPQGSHISDKPMLTG